MSDIGISKKKLYMCEVFETVGWNLEKGEIFWEVIQFAQEA